MDSLKKHQQLQQKKKQKAKYLVKEINVFLFLFLFFFLLLLILETISKVSIFLFGLKNRRERLVLRWLDTVSSAFKDLYFDG